MNMKLVGVSDFIIDMSGFGHPVSDNVLTRARIDELFWPCITIDMQVTWQDEEKSLLVHGCH